MRRLFFAIVFFVVTSGFALAQDVPAIEVFGGYSLLKLDMADQELNTAQGDLEMPGVQWSIDENSNLLRRGGTGAVAFNLADHFGIVIDARYNQGDLQKGSFTFRSEELQTDVTTPFTIAMKNVSLLVGPRVSFRNDRATVFLHTLAGVDYWRLTGDFTMMGDKVRLTSNNTGFGMTVGGGLDVNVSDSIALRVIQADYYLTRHMERLMNNVNLSFGVVFRIGVR